MMTVRRGFEHVSGLLFRCQTCRCVVVEDRKDSDGEQMLHEVWHEELREDGEDE